MKSLYFYGKSLKTNGKKNNARAKRDVLNGELQPHIQAEKREQNGFIRNVLSFPVSDAFATAKVMLFASLIVMYCADGAK